MSVETQAYILGLDTGDTATCWGLTDGRARWRLVSIYSDSLKIFCSTRTIHVAVGSIRGILILSSTERNGTPRRTNKTQTEATKVIGRSASSIVRREPESKCLVIPPAFRVEGRIK